MTGFAYESLDEFPTEVQDFVNEYLADSVENNVSRDELESGDLIFSRVPEDAYGFGMAKMEIGVYNPEDDFEFYSMGRVLAENIGGKTNSVEEEGIRAQIFGYSERTEDVEVCEKAPAELSTEIIEADPSEGVMLYTAKEIEGTGQDIRLGYPGETGIHKFEDQEEVLEVLEKFNEMIDEKVDPFYTKSISD